MVVRGYWEGKNISVNSKVWVLYYSGKFLVESCLKVQLKVIWKNIPGLLDGIYTEAGRCAVEDERKDLGGV